MAKKFDYDYEMEMQRKRKFKKILVNGAIVTCLITAFCFGLSYIKEGLIAEAAETKVEDVRDKAINEETHEINFDVAKKLGCNTKSWLYIPDTGIDYPLVQTTDNDFYVDHDCYGNPSSSGAIFIHYGNEKDLSDGKTVIFGHNMLNSSMFANLKNYSDEKWGRVHPDAYAFLDNGKVRHYRLRYYIYTNPYDKNIYVTSKAEQPSVTAELLRAEAGIVYEEYTGGRLICLSTCTHHTERTVVVFEEVDDKFPVMIKGSEYFNENATDCSEDAQTVTDEATVVTEDDAFVSGDETADTTSADVAADAGSEDDASDDTFVSDGDAGSDTAEGGADMAPTTEGE